MAGSGVDDVSTQLGLTNQLLQTNQLISEVLERITGQYAQQLDLLRRMGEVMSEMNTDVFRRISDEALEAMDSITELTESMIDLNEVLLELDDSYVVADKSQRQFSDNVVKGARRGVKENENLTENLYTLTKVYDKLKKKTKEYFNALARTSIPLLAIQGLIKGFSNLFAVVGAGIGIIGTIAGAIAKFAFSVIMFPVKMLKGIIDLAASTDSNLYQIFEKIKGVFGDLNGPTSNSIITTAKNMAGFEQTGLSAMRVFGTFGERMELLLNLAQEMGPAFMKLQRDFKGSEGVALAYQKGLGLVGDEMKTLTTRAQAFGLNSEDIFKDITKQAYGLGKAFGIDAKILGKDVAKALKDVAHFGNASVKQLAQAATYARGLGTELDKITGVMDAFDSFEDAATNASKLNQYLGIQVNSFKMMAAETPDEKLNMLRAAMMRTGKSAESLDRWQLRLLSSSVNLDVETTRLAFSMKNQGLSLEQIKKQGAGLDKKTLTQEEAMSKLADAIDKLVKVQEGGFFNQFLSGIGAGIQDTKEFQDALYEIKGSLQSAYEWGINFGKMIMQKFPAIREMIIGIGKLFSPEKFGKFLSDIGKSFENFIHDMTTGDFSLGKLMDSLKENFFSWFDSTKAGSGLLKTAEKLLNIFTETIVQGVSLASDALARGMMSIADIINGKKPMPGMAQDGQNFLTRSLSRLGDAFMSAAEKLWPALKEFMAAMLKKIGEIIMSPELAGVRNKIMLALATVTFGPAFLQMGLGILAKTLMGAGPKIAQVVTTAAGSTGSVVGAVPGTMATGVSTVGGVCAPGQGPILPSGPGSPLSPTVVNAATATPSTQLNAAASAMPAVGAYLRAFAGMVAIGLVAFFAAVALIRAFNVKEEEVKSAGIAIAAIGATVLMMTPALKIMAIPIPGGEISILKTMGMLAGVLISGLVPFAIALGIVKDVKIEDVMAASAVLATIPIVIGLAAGAAWIALTASAIPEPAANKGLKAIATVMFVGLLEVLAAMGAIKAFNIDDKTISATGDLLMAMVPPMLASVAVVYAAMGIGRILEGPGAQLATQGLIGMGIVLGAMGLTAVGLAALVKEVPADTLRAAGTVLDAVSSAFLKAAGVVFALIGIGALSAATSFLSDASIAAGLISVGSVIAMMVKTVNDILTSLNGLNADPAKLKAKAEAFAAVMTTVVNLTEKIGNIISALDLSSDTQDASVKFAELNKFVSDFIGKPGSQQGMVGLIEKIMDSLKSVNKKDIAAAQAIGPVMSATADLLGKISDGSAKLIESESSWIIGRGKEHTNIMSAIEETERFVVRIGGATVKLAKSIAGVLTDMSADKLRVLKVAGGAFGSLLGAVSSLVGSLSGAIEKFKETKKTSALWGAISIEDTGLDLEKISKFLDLWVGNLEKYSGPINSFVSRLVTSFNDLRVSKTAVELMKEIGPIIGAVGSIMSSVSTTFEEKSTETEKPDKTKIKEIIKSTPDYTKIFDQMGQVFPDLVNKILALLGSVPYGTEISKKIGVLSKIFDIASKVPEIAKTISDIDMPPLEDKPGAKQVQGFEKINVYLASLMEGGESSVIKRMISLISRLSTHISFESTGVNISKVAGKVDKFFTKAKNLVTSISSLETEDSKDVVAPNFTSLNNYFADLLKPENSLTSFLENMQAVFRQFKSVSEKNIPDITRTIQKIKDNIEAIDDLVGASPEYGTSLSEGAQILRDTMSTNLPRPQSALSPFDFNRSATVKPILGSQGIMGYSEGLGQLVQGEIVINVNLDVKMDAAQIESQILKNPRSEIRVRLNRALDARLPSTARAVNTTELLPPENLTHLTKVPLPRERGLVQLVNTINGNPAYADVKDGSIRDLGSRTYVK